MASSSPTLTTIPREKIWELLLIKNEEQDPAAQREFWLPEYPVVKAAIYLVNHQLNQEHNENLRKRDKRLNMHIGTKDLPSLLEKDLVFGKTFRTPHSSFT